MSELNMVNQYGDHVFMNEPKVVETWNHSPFSKTC